jgi:retron-type reverse transcriptase
MPVQKTDGQVIDREGKAIPQGVVISPLLGNLFLHYSFDIWITRRLPDISFDRYADDIRTLP